jgi:hypothetical protein
LRPSKLFIKNVKRNFLPVQIIPDLDVALRQELQPESELVHVEVERDKSEKGQKA